MNPNPSIQNCLSDLRHLLLADLEGEYTTRGKLLDLYIDLLHSAKDLDAMPKPQAEPAAPEFSVSTILLIKALRQVSNLGLKEAKDLIDLIRSTDAKNKATRWETLAPIWNDLFRNNERFRIE